MRGHRPHAFVVSGWRWLCMLPLPACHHACTGAGSVGASPEPHCCGSSIVFVAKTLSSSRCATRATLPGCAHTCCPCDSPFISTPPLLSPSNVVSPSPFPSLLQQACHARSPPAGVRAHLVVCVCACCRCPSVITRVPEPAAVATRH